MDCKEIIQSLRKQKKVSIKKLSELSGIYNNTISNWVYCNVEPTINNFEKVIKALGYKLEIIKEDEQ